MCHDYDDNFIRPAEYGTVEKAPYDSCWCKPENGFPEGFRCSDTYQCDFSKNLYCNIPAHESIGTCSPCPSVCGGLGDSCSFCSDPSKMQCGQPSYYDTAMCYLPDPNSVYGYLSNFMDCFGAAGLSGCIMNSYTNNAKELNKCMAGEDCIIKIGDGCFDFSYVDQRSTSFDIPTGNESDSNSSFLGMDEQQMAGLSAEQWEQISKRQWGHKFVFSEKDNMNYDDVSIDRDQAFLELDANTSCEPSVFGKVDSEGEISLKGRMEFEINPRKLTVKATYEIELNIAAIISLKGGIDTDTGHCEKIIALTNSRNMYRQVFMLGYFPISVVLDMQPYLWLNLDLSGSNTNKAAYLTRQKSENTPT
jgi:hypothetical protein